MEKTGELLGTVEYAHATSVNASTKLTPFEIDTGRKVSNLIAHEYKYYDGMDLQPISEFTSKVAKDRQDLERKARGNLVQAQERQKKYYDSKRTSLTFNVGDLVPLDTKDLPLRTFNAHIDLKKAKLTAKKFGPFEIILMINPNVAKLKLPQNITRLSLSFNVEYSIHIIEYLGVRWMTDSESITNHPRVRYRRVTSHSGKVASSSSAQPPNIMASTKVRPPGV